MHGSKVWAAVVLAGLVAATSTAGCSCGDSSSPSGSGAGKTTGGNGGGGNGGGSEGDGMLKSGALAATEPAFDATLSDDGSILYFTGVSSKGNGAVFSVPASGGDPTPVTQSGLVAPFGIALSTDGKTLFVADPGAESASEDGGSIFSVTAEGGSVSAVSGTAGMVPRSLDVIDEGGTPTIFFSGSVKNVAGVFKIAAKGGKVSVVASGDSFHDPAGIAVAKDGTVYVVDTVAGSRHDATVLAVTNGKVSTLLPHADVGYPAGVALAQDESALLVSGLDEANGNASVLRVDLKSHEVVDFPGPKTKLDFTAFYEPGGLHRARKADKYALVIGDPHGGVYLLK
jgi:sugar lactone lactonase YvrE